MDVLLDYKDSQVTAMGHKIGSIESDEVKNFIRRCMSNDVTLSTRLRKEILKVYVQYDTCPTCGGPMEVVTTAGPVEIGYCIDCRRSLHRFENKVVDTYSAQTGIVRVYDRLGTMPVPFLIILQEEEQAKHNNRRREQ